MLTVNNVTGFLLDRRLIEAAWVIDGPLSIRSLPRRNRNLMIVGPGTTGFLIKQPLDPSEGGFETLRREAMFHDFCREEPAAAPITRFVPRLVDRDLSDAILVFELIPGVATLLSQLEDPRCWGILAEASQAFGRTLGTFHRVVRAIDPDDPRLTWLPRVLPMAMDLHKPRAARRGTLSRAVCDVLRIIQEMEGVDDALDHLRDLWRPETVIHGDIKFDNVLVRTDHSSAGTGAIAVWIADWERVQAGDPAWDLAGALQDLLVTWVRSMPREGGLDGEAMMARAELPVAAVRGVAQAVWSGYREEAGLDPDEVDGFLLRAVKYSAAQLLYNACQWSWYEDRMPAIASMLLEVAENLLMEPERGQVLLYGISRGEPTS